MFPLKQTPNDQIILLNPQKEITQYSGGSFSFGWIPPGEISKTLIAYLKIPNITGIGKINIGLTNIGNLSFLPNTFGCEPLPIIDTNHSPTTFFSQLNNSFNKNSNNILVPTRNSNESYYVYLNVNFSNSSFGWNGTIKYRWYIDYAN